jgi:small GTP-binding protein
LSTAKTLKSKVCLVGEVAVGKSSLIARYVTDRFDPRYIMTIGTKVVKKSVDVHVDARDTDVSVEMTIWDIMGEKGFRQLLKEAYFYGANGILAVCDLTRRSTLEDLDDWADHILRVVGDVPMIVAVNKADLADDAKFAENEVSTFLSAYGASYVYTSAKTGQNVEQAFGSLARAMVHQQLGWEQDAAASRRRAPANADPTGG